MKHLIFALSLILFVGSALAGTTVTVVPGVSQLKPADGSPNINYKPKDGTPTPHDQCASALTALNGAGLCWDSFSLLIVKDCADVPAPTIPLVKQTAPDGSVSWLEPDSRAELAKGSDTLWITTQNLYVHNPAWPAGAPDCWVRGFTADEWRPNGTDPNAPVMERKEEGMADLPDGPLDTTPAPESPEFIASWTLPESCERRHHDHICYPPGSPGETCGPCT